MKALQEYAEEHHTSMYEALRDLADTETFRNTKSHAFLQLIDEYSTHIDEKPVSQVLAELLDRSGYEEMMRTEGSQERLDYLAELKQSIYEWETTVGEETDMVSYLRHIALFTNTDTYVGNDKVRLMTVHSAKGLEFPYVFLCEMCEGIFPSRKVRTKSGMEEERRLAFVAMTRAEKELYLSDAEGRNFDNTSRYPSRFLLDIDPQCLIYVEKPDEKFLAKAQKNVEKVNDSFLPDLEELDLHEGDRVRHRVFGDGTIIEINVEEEAVMVKFDSMPTARTIALRAAKKLEKIRMS